VKRYREHNYGGAQDRQQGRGEALPGVGDQEGQQLARFAGTPPRDGPTLSSGKSLYHLCPLLDIVIVCKKNDDNFNHARTKHQPRLEIKQISHDGRGMLDQQQAKLTPVGNKPTSARASKFQVLGRHYSLFMPLAPQPGSGCFCLHRRHPAPARISARCCWQDNRVHRPRADTVAVKGPLPHSVNEVEGNHHEKQPKVEHYPGHLFAAQDGVTAQSKGPGA
jgi:hypothetical protein